MNPRIIALAVALLCPAVGCKTTESPKKDEERNEGDARYPRDERPYEPPVTSGSQDCYSATDQSTCVSRSCEWDYNSSSCRDASTLPTGGGVCNQYQNQQQCLQYASSGCSWDYNSNRCSSNGGQGGLSNCQQYVSLQQCLQYMSRGCSWDYNFNRCYGSGGTSGNNCQVFQDQYSCQRQAQQGCRWDAYQRVCTGSVTTNFCQNYRDPFQCRQVPGCQWMQNGIQGYCFGGTAQGGYTNCQQYNSQQVCQQYFQQCRWEVSLFSARCVNR